MLPLWKAGRSAAQDVLRDHIKEPEGSSFHLTLPISGVLQSMHFLISPRALCWHWETNLEAAGCGFFCCKESIKNRLHTQQNRYIFVSLASCVSPELCVITNTFLLNVFFSSVDWTNCPFRDDMTRDVQWFQEVLTFVDCGTNQAPLVPEPISVCRDSPIDLSDSAMNPGCFVYLLVRKIQRNIWSSHLVSLSVGETLFMAGILCKDSSCCRCWQIWLSHTCQDAKQSQGNGKNTLAECMNAGGGDLKWFCLVCQIQLVDGKRSSNQVKIIFYVLKSAF